jgi:AraC-like DNA-binding protein
MPTGLWLCVWRSETDLTTDLAVHVIAVLGLVQGLVLIGALYRVRGLNPTGFVCLLIALAATWAIVLEEWLVFGEMWLEFPHILRSTTWMPYLIGPGLWLFARTLREPFELRWSWLHFLPALLALISFIPFYWQSGESKIAFVAATHSIPLATSLHGAAKAVSMLVYLAMALVVLWRLPVTRLTRGVFWIVAAFLVFVFLVASNFLTEHLDLALPISSDLLAVIGLAGLMYSVSILVLMQWQGFISTPADETKSAKTANASNATPLLDDTTTQALFDEVVAKVESRQIYLEPGMNVSMLAGEVGLQAHYLSYVINIGAGQNVKAWLNRLRVKDAKKWLLAEPDTPVLDIALRCGFNSKAAFNRTFKTETGMTPSNFRGSHFPK